VQVLTQAKVTEVMPTGVRLADGRVVESELVVWAAGVKAPDFLKDFGGLETESPSTSWWCMRTLQTTRDPDIFALGDCAACPVQVNAAGGRAGMVPPRAQAAHQQATHVFQQIKRRFADKPLQAVPLQRLRLTRLAGQVRHRGQHDGRIDWQQLDD
jgi:NADH dehydrogenase